MRVKFGNKIYFCTKVFHTAGSSMLRITIENEIYQVDISDSKKADELYLQLLVDGYCDLTEFNNLN